MVKRRHVTLIIPQKLEIIRGGGGFENGKSLNMVTASYNILSPTICDMKKQKDQLRSFIAWHESTKGIFDNENSLK